MRDGLGGIALGQKRITQKLMSDRKVRAQFQGALQRSDGRTVVMFLHVCRAEIYEGVRQSWIKLGGLAKLRNLQIELMLLTRLQAVANMIGRAIGRSALRSKPSNQEKLNHELPGSRTSRK